MFIVITGECFSQDNSSMFTKTKDYSFTVSVLEVTNNKFCSILDSAIYESERCNNIPNISKFVIKVLPIQGKFLIGGIHISRIEDDHCDWDKFESIGLLEYSSYSFIVCSKIKGDFHDYHWAFKKTKEEKEITFCVKYEVYEDTEIEHYLNWWYVYYSYVNEFKLSYYYDCFGQEHISSILYD